MKLPRRIPYGFNLDMWAGGRSISSVSVKLQEKIKATTTTKNSHAADCLIKSYGPGDTEAVSWLHTMAHRSLRT